MSSLIEDFNKTNQWDITVNATTLNSPDEMQEHMELAIEEGSPPDITVAYLYQAAAWDGDLLVELDDYVDDPIWGFTPDEQDDFFPIFWKHDKLEGVRLGIPAHRSAQMLYYNSTWAEELGFHRPPSTPAQFKQQACAAAKAVKEDENPENDTRGGWIISTNYAAVLGWLFAFEGQVTDPKGDVYLFATPEVEEALSFLRELFEQGCAWLPEGELGDVSEREFANRFGLFSTGSLTDIPYQEEAFADAKSVDEWSVLSFPSYDNQAAITVYGPSYFILKSTPEKQLASWLLIQWLASAENQAKLIKASGGFPLKASVLEIIDEGIPPLDQWIMAVDLLPRARAEPNLPSWRTVRWTVNDVAIQLYRWYFTMEQLPATIKLFDKTANELHAEDQSRNE
jgi:ABC-type glycerol-3-phosphate transport system substrate-binding protein